MIVGEELNHLFLSGSRSYGLYKQESMKTGCSDAPHSYDYENFTIFVPSKKTCFSLVIDFVVLHGRNRS